MISIDKDKDGSYGIYHVNTGTGKRTLITSHKSFKEAQDKLINNGSFYNKFEGTLMKKDSISMANANLKLELNQIKADNQPKLDSLNLAIKNQTLENSKLQEEVRLKDVEIKNIKMKNDSTKLARLNEPVAKLGPGTFDENFLKDSGYPVNDTIVFYDINEWQKFQKAEKEYLSLDADLKQDSLKNVISEQKIEYAQETHQMKIDNQALKEEKYKSDRVADSLNYAIKELEFELKSNKVDQIAYNDSIAKAIDKFKLDSFEQKALKDSLDIEIKKLKIQNEELEKKGKKVSNKKDIAGQQSQVKSIVKNIKSSLVQQKMGRAGDYDAQVALYEKLKAELIAEDSKYWTKIFKTYDADIQDAKNKMK